MSLLSFSEWHNQKIMVEGPRSLSPNVARAVKNTTDQIDAEILGIQNQLKQLQARQNELKAKKERIIRGMGGGYLSNDLTQPNDFMKYYDRELGRRPDMPSNGNGYPVDYGSTKQVKRRQNALQSANQDREEFTSPAAFNFFQKISRSGPGEYPVPRGVSPDDAQKIVQMMIGNNKDYEDFGIYAYNAEDNTIHVGGPTDI